MLGHRTSLLAVLLLVLGLTTVAAPAQAGMRSYWAYDEHPAGMPATDDSARTVESAEAHIDDQSRVQATITLGAEPDAESDADLYLVFGSSDDEGGCTSTTELIVPTVGSRTVDVESTLDVPATTDSCTYVTLVDRESGTVLDHVDGRLAGVVIVDPARPVQLAVSDREVTPHRWSGVKLVVRLARDASRVRVSGTGADLRAKTVDVRDVPAGRMTLRLPVKLRADAPRRLDVRVLATFPDGRAAAFLRVRLLLVR